MDPAKNVAFSKILIINLGGIGDLLLSTPALRALKSWFQRSEICLLVVPRVHQLASELPYVDEAFAFHTAAIKSPHNLRTLLVLRRKKFDLAINMRTLVTERSAKKFKVLLEVIKPKTKVGRDTEGRGCFFDIRIPESDIGEKYEMEYDIDTIKALGVKVIDKSIDFHIDDKNMQKVNEILRKERVGEGDILIGIHPGGQPSRRWPLEKFSKVMEEINEQISSKFAITGGKDEVHLVHELIEMTNVNAINLVRKLDIKELGALIKRCNLYISNDTGSMHIAAILKTPLVAIFGPGDITRYDPGNISDQVAVLYKKVDCSPCNKVRCSNLKCLKTISPREVVEATGKFLDI